MNRVGDIGMSLAIMVMFATFGHDRVLRCLRWRSRGQFRRTSCSRPAAAAGGGR